MLTTISYIAAAAYLQDGTVNMVIIPVGPVPGSEPGFLWTANSTNIALPSYASVIMIKLLYHNSLEDEDPYYKVTTYSNYTDNEQGVTVPAKSYYYVYSLPSININDNQFIVFATKDDEIICSLPEAMPYDYQSGVAAGAAYYDYDTWRISKDYMPNLVPSA